LVVTAEPYFAVSRPSDVIVMENEVRADTVGKIESMDTKYELLQRGQYQHLTNVLDLKVNGKMPLELYEARNAVQIARTSGADKYATDTFLKAEDILKQAEAYRKRNAGSRPITMTARQAVQTAEDARAIAVKRQDDDLIANDRRAVADRALRAENGQAAAESETDRVKRLAAGTEFNSLVEAGRVKSLNDAQTAAAQNEADRLKQINADKLASARNETEKLRQQNNAQTAASSSEADRLREINANKLAAAQLDAENQRQQNALQASAAGTEADRLKRENDAQRATSQSELDRLSAEKRQLQTEKTDLRALLLLQFNAILQTRDTARGLIVNMSDVLFDTGKFSLRPEAREKLAKVAGIVSGHPGLRLAVEGNTDSVGGDAYNQTLSEERGGSVRDYLISEGMPGSSVTSAGFGKNQPVASNDTAAGRQQNRRVEIVISGEVIGTVIGTPIAAIR
jgi:outer membrane protein OmpA-like peptidoglycan-associated protein